MKHLITIGLLILATLGLGIGLTILFITLLYIDKKITELRRRYRIVDKILNILVALFYILSIGLILFISYMSIYIRL